MYKAFAVSSGKRNASMPVTQESWLTCSSIRARLEALKAPPRHAICCNVTTKDVRIDIDSSVGLFIFDEQSNADGDMATGSFSPGGGVRGATATRGEVAGGGTCFHPRAGYNSERFVCATVHQLVDTLTLAKAPSSDWVRREARLARDGLAGRGWIPGVTERAPALRLRFDAAADCVRTLPATCWLMFLESKAEAGGER